MAHDAVVIGAGPNGLVAANLLADRGWSVLVVEEQDAPGGAVKSGELVAPGYVSDHFSAFYPLAAASPYLQSLELESHGLTWRRSQYAVAHPLEDGSCVAISTDLDETCAMLDADCPGDGDAWRRLYRLYEQIGPDLIGALMTPFPPVRNGIRMAAALQQDLLRFMRFGVVPVRRLAEETFKGAGGANLLAGNALHADLTPDSSGGGLFGWLLCSLGQAHGFPVPEGGAGKLTEALVTRLRSRGGELHTGRRATKIVIKDGRATAVRTADGDVLEARKAVLADTGAPQLYLDLVDETPARVREDLEKFQYDSSTVKIDWALSGPIPWAAPEARRAGTVHVTEGIDHLTRTAADIVCHRVPERPFLILGQYSMVDATRMPDGRESAWAYTHVPYRGWDDAMTDDFVARCEAEVERRAPGFTKLIRARHVFTPDKLQAANRNLVRGAVNSGTAQLHQQVVLRPVPSLGRPETPFKGLYLASASAHPGGGVHGGPGGNAARVALKHAAAARFTRPVTRAARALDLRPTR